MGGLELNSVREVFESTYIDSLGPMADALANFFSGLQLKSWKCIDIVYGR